MGVAFFTGNYHTIGFELRFRENEDLDGLEPCEIHQHMTRSMWTTSSTRHFNPDKSVEKDGKWEIGNKSTLEPNGQWERECHC